MASHGIGAHERELLEEFTASHNQRWSRVAEATMEGSQEVREMNRTISFAGKYTRVGGFLGKDHWAMHVARLTAEQKWAIEQIDSEIMTDKRKFYFWLENIAPGSDVRGKVLVYG